MTILLIDLSGIVHAQWHVSTADPNPDATSIAAVAKVRALASGQPHVAVCIDTGRSFRRDVSPDYKANRPERDAALVHQMQLTIDTLRGDGFPVWGAAGFEADDVIASAVHLVLNGGVDGYGTDDDRLSSNTLICSSDKDLLQLVSDRVQVKSLTNGLTYDAAAVQEKFSVAPHQMNDFLCLVGDASDNVKGAQGIGAKTAAKLLNTFGNLADLYAALDRKEAALTPAVTASLTAFRERWPVVRELITLRADAPVPFDEIFKERVPADVAVFGDEGEPMEPMDTISAGAVAEAGQMPLAEAAAALQAPTPSAGTTSPAAGGLPSEPNGGDSAASQSLARQPEPLPAPVEWDRQLEPRSQDELRLAAKFLFESRLFSQWGAPQAVFAIGMAGRELGLGLMTSLRAFHNVESKPAMHADFIRARAEMSPDCEYFMCTERTNEACTWETKHKKHPRPTVLRYTIEDARTAWAKKDKDGNIDERSFLASGYGKNPADMLVARASSKLARLVYPGQVHGFYSPEELTNG